MTFPDDAHAQAHAHVLATPDQIATERLALRLVERPDVRAAREAARRHLLADPVCTIRDARLGLERALDQWVLALAMREANGDPARPRITWNVDNSPREWHGHVYPGAAVAVDNPDNINRELPLDGSGRYRLEIQLSGRPASLSVMLEVEPEHHAGIGRNIGTLGALAIKPDAQGRVSVTIDSEPAGDRLHHLQSEAGRLQCYVRDSMSDWAQIPSALTIIRLDPVRAAERSEEDIAAAVVAALPHWVKFWSGFKDSFLGPPEHNRLVGPQGRVGGWGFMAGGRFKLADDEALLITVERAGAAYMGLQVTDPWTIAPDPALRSASLNLAQASPNPDGSYSFVIAPVEWTHDRHCLNWIDCCGLNEGWMLLRWQGVPPEADPTRFIREVQLISSGQTLTRRDRLLERARLHRQRTSMEGPAR